LGFEFAEARGAVSDFCVVLAGEVTEFLGEALSRVGQAAI
jgi:hypothetical protein